MTKIKVIVTLKPSLLDAQGRVVKEGLHSLGYSNVSSIRIGKYMELELEPSGDLDIETQVKEMCEKLLANTVIENYTFEVAE